MDQISIGKECKLVYMGPGYWCNPRSSVLVTELEDDESKQDKMADLCWGTPLPLQARL
jgi:hypothetical protein